jgi:phage terminase large subunit
MADVKVELPNYARGLFTPKRYKVYWGGRGAARSWSYAQAILIMGAQRQLRVLCAREFQKSIADSVHKLFQDQIQRLGLSGWQITN